MTDNGATFTVKIKTEGLEATKKALQSLQNVGSKVAKGLASAFSSTLSAIFSIKSAVLGLVGVGGFGLLINKISSAIDHIGKLSQQVGVSTENLGAWAYAADLAGVSLDIVVDAMGLMATATQEFVRTGGGPASDSLKKLGISSSTLTPILNDSNELFKLFADKISELPDGAEKAALSMEIFGRAGKDLIPLLNEGSVGFEQMKADAERFGLTMSGDLVKNVEIANDSFSSLKARIFGIFYNLYANLAPVIEDLFDSLNERIGNFIKDEGGFNKFIQKLTISVLEFGKSITSTFQNIVNSLITIVNTALQLASKLPAAVGGGFKIFGTEEERQSEKIRVQAALDENIEAVEKARKKYEDLQKQSPVKGFFSAFFKEGAEADEFRMLDERSEILKNELKQIENASFNIQKIDLSNITQGFDSAVESASRFEVSIEASKEAVVLLQEEFNKLSIREFNRAPLITQEDIKNGYELYDINKAINDESARQLILQVDPAASIGEAYARRTEMVNAALESELITEQRSVELKLELQKSYFDQLKSMQEESFLYSINFTQQLAEANSKSLEQNANTMVGHFASVAAAASQYSQGAFEANKAFSIANAIVSGGEAAVNAYAFGAKLGGPFLGATFAAAALAATGLQINAIRSTKRGATGGQGATATPSLPQRVQPAQITQNQQPNVQITINGDVTGQEVIDKVTSAIKEKFNSDDIFFGPNTAQARQR